MHTTATANALTTAVSTAIAAIPAGATSEDAYKAFMNALGEGFTEALGNALAAAAGALDAQAGTSGANPNLVDISDLLKKGASVQLFFSTPGLTVPLTQKIAAKQGMVVGPSGSATTMGGSVGVTGTYSF